MNLTENDMDNGAGVFCAFTDDEADSIDSFIPGVAFHSADNGSEAYAEDGHCCE